MSKCERNGLARIPKSQTDVILLFQLLCFLRCYMCFSYQFLSNVIEGLSGKQNNIPFLLTVDESKNKNIFIEEKKGI